MLQKSQIRKDYILDRYVIVTPGRAKRPKDVEEENRISRIKKCVFCPENIEYDKVTDMIGTQDKWTCLTVPNKYPAVTLDNQDAYGYQEVLVETPKHGLDLGELSQEHIQDVLQLYKQRTQDISTKDSLDYVLVFKNSGGRAGASILHAHSQIFATQILPPDVEEELQRAEKISAQEGKNVYARIIRQEEQDGSRMVYQDKNIVAFAPYASQYHYEVWLFTRRRVDNITQINASEEQSIAAALKIVLGKLNSLEINYNFFLHQVISNRNQHFYIKIQPRDSVWAGVEMGSGIVINSIPPEEAAKFYRK